MILHNIARKYKDISYSKQRHDVILLIVTLKVDAETQQPIKKQVSHLHVFAGFCMNLQQ